MYKDWIIARLPKDIPEEVITYAAKEIDNNFGGYIVGLQFWDYGERGWNIRQWMKLISSYGCLREPFSTSP